MARGLFAPAVALGTTRLVGRPIARKSLAPLALTGAMLATIGAKRWPEPIKLRPTLGTRQEVGVDLATVEEMRARAHSPLGEILLHHGAPDTIRGGRWGGQHVGDQRGLSVITGLTQVGLIAHPWCLTFGAVTRFELLRRLELQGRRWPFVLAAPTPLLHPGLRTAGIWLQPALAEDLQGRQRPPMAGIRLAPEALQEGVAFGPDRHGQGVALARLLGAAQRFGTRAVALRPHDRHVRPPPRRSGCPELMERRPQRFEDPFKPVEGAHGRQAMRGIRPWRAAGLDPPPRFAGGQEGIEQPLSGLRGASPLPKIV